MLNSMGAKISGIGSNFLHIEGVKELKGCYHRVLPDMIEIGSFIGLAAMTKSEITIKDVSYDNLGIIPNVFKRMGIKLERRGDDIYVPAQDHYEIDTFIDGSILTIYDAPWPGFTPDLLSIILVSRRSMSSRWPNLLFSLLFGHLNERNAARAYYQFPFPRAGVSFFFFFLLNINR